MTPSGDCWVGASAQDHHKNLKNLGYALTLGARLSDYKSAGKLGNIFKSSSCNTRHVSRAAVHSLDEQREGKKSYEIATLV